jgi:hypothetical protein
MHSHDSDGIIVEDGRDIFRRELIGGITDEKTCLSNRTIAHDHTSEEIKISRRFKSTRVRSWLTEWRLGSASCKF